MSGVASAREITGALCLYDALLRRGDCIRGDATMNHRCCGGGNHAEPGAIVRCGCGDIRIR